MDPPSLISLCCFSSSRDAVHRYEIHSVNEDWLNALMHYNFSRIKCNQVSVNHWKFANSVSFGMFEVGKLKPYWPETLEYRHEQTL